MVIQKAFAPIKRLLPTFLSNVMRGTVTALLTPIMYSYRTGHFLSSIKMAAVSKNGEPIPWYTYPCIDFLRYRNYDTKYVLEFGGGQSTLWWAKRAKRVITLEGDLEWFDKVKAQMPENVDINYVSMESAAMNVAQVKKVLSSKENSRYDVIIIDGLYRFEMIEIARNRIAEDGIIICDNAEGYGFYEGFKESGLNRVDFYGNAPGVVLPHSTSIYFKASSFAFDPIVPIHSITNEK